MRGDIESLNAHKEDGRRRFGVKLLGAVISVALLVAVAVAAGGSEKEVGTRDLIVASDVNMAQKIEQDVFKSTGLHVTVVQPEDLAALSETKSEYVEGDGWTNIGGVFALKAVESGRWLSSKDGKDKKLVTENSVSGTTEKWDIQVDASVPKYRFYKSGTTNRCIKMNDSGQVKLNDSCGSDNAKMILLRVDADTSPTSNYNENKFLIYRYGGKQKFIVVSTSGDVGASDDPIADNKGLFEFVTQ